MNKFSIRELDLMSLAFEAGQLDKSNNWYNGDLNEFLKTIDEIKLNDLLIDRLNQKKIEEKLKNKPKVHLPSYGEIDYCYSCGAGVDEIIDGHIGYLVDTSEEIQLCEDCLCKYEEINKNGKLYIIPKTVDITDCSFDVEGFIILLEYDKENERDWNFQYTILNEDFNRLFTRYYWANNDYCINEWRTTEFQTQEDMIKFLLSIGLKQL